MSQHDHIRILSEPCMNWQPWYIVFVFFFHATVKWSISTVNITKEMFEAAVVPYCIQRVILFIFLNRSSMSMSVWLWWTYSITLTKCFSAFSEMLNCNVLPNNYLCIKLFIRILIVQLNSAVLGHTQLSSYLWQWINTLRNVSYNFYNLKTSRT